MDEVSLEFREDALRDRAEGHCPQDRARGLRSIMENILMPMFETTAAISRKWSLTGRGR